jgi:hypothetical protein
MATNNYAERYEYEAQLKRRIIKYVIYSVLGIIALTFIFGAFYTIDAGERGIILTFGKASESIAQPGLHFKFPLIQSVIKTSVRTQTINFDNKKERFKYLCPNHYKRTFICFKTNSKSCGFTAKIIISESVTTVFKSFTFKLNFFLSNSQRKLSFSQTETL